jgi:peptide deformylase
MLLKLYQTGQPILRKRAKKVSSKQLASKPVQELIDFMVATLRDAPGVGLAAPQVGKALQIIILDDKSKYHEQVPSNVLKAQGRKPVPLKVLVNPKLKVIDPVSQLWFEGCLSVDGYLAAVPRAKSVQVEALDRRGKSVSYKARGWQARILQHELDHLNGVLFIDCMQRKSFMSLKNFNNLWRKALQAEIRKAFL